MTKTVFDVLLPVPGGNPLDFVLCTCETVDALAAIVRTLFSNGVKGPERVIIERKTVACDDV